MEEKIKNLKLKIIEFTRELEKKKEEENNCVCVKRKRQEEQIHEKTRMSGSVMSMSSEIVDSTFYHIQVKEEPDDEFIPEDLPLDIQSMDEDSIDIKEEDIGYGQSNSRSDTDNSIQDSGLLTPNFIQQNLLISTTTNSNSSSGTLTFSSSSAANELTSTDNSYDNPSSPPLENTFETPNGDHTPISTPIEPTASETQNFNQVHISSSPLTENNPMSPPKDDDTPTSPPDTNVNLTPETGSEDENIPLEFYKSSKSGHKNEYSQKWRIRRYKCDKCDYSSKFKSGYDSHKIVHQKDSEVNYYYCNLCPKKYKHKCDLKKHAKKCQPPEHQ